MSSQLEAITGSNKSRILEQVERTEEYKIIKRDLENRRGYKLGDSKVVGLRDRPKDRIVNFEVEDSDKNTIFEVSITLHNDGVQDINITKDIVKNNKIVKTEVYKISDNQVLLDKEV